MNTLKIPKTDNQKLKTEEGQTIQLTKEQITECKQ